MKAYKGHRKVKILKGNSESNCAAGNVTAIVVYNSEIVKQKNLFLSVGYETSNCFCCSSYGIQIRFDPLKHNSDY